MAEEKLNYPKARRCNCTIDKYHQDSIYDVYRWLEEVQNEDVKTFITEQNELTSTVLKECTFMETVKTRMKEMLDYSKYSCPTKEGNRYFYFKSNGFQDGRDLHIQKYVNGESKIFLEHKSICTNGIKAIVDYKVSPSGRIMAYSLSRGSSHQGNVNFKGIETKEVIEDVLENVQLSNKYTSVCWNENSRGVFYVRYPKINGTDDKSKPIPLQNGKIFYHRIHSPQSSDVLIAEFPEHPEWRSEIVVSDCGTYLVNHVFQGPNNNSVYIASLDEKETQLKTKLEFIPIITEFEADFRYVTNEDSIFYFHTNKDSPNYCVIGIELSDSNELTWINLIPHDPRNVLTRVMPVKTDKLLTTYMIDVKTIIQLREMKDGSLLKNFQTDTGNVASFWSERKLGEFFLETSSFNAPKKFFHIDLNGLQEPKPFLTSRIKNFDTGNTVAVQVTYENDEKQKIQMTIVKKRTTNQNGGNPCLLIGHSGLNTCMSPTFNELHMFFVQEFNGIVAYPHIRGGGEFGTNWYLEGQGLKKPNSLNDFQTATDYLLDNMYTNITKLAILGYGHGGLQAAACINRRPEVCKAVVIQNGIMDMLRFHKFPIGYTWISEYGCSTSENTKMFEVLNDYSPLHNVSWPEEIQYPAILLTTNVEDDKFSPIHSYKFIAELQATIGQQPRQENPLLIRIGGKTGDGGFITNNNQMAEWTDIMAFLSLQLNVTMNS